MQETLRQNPGEGNNKDVIILIKKFLEPRKESKKEPRTEADNPQETGEKKPGMERVEKERRNSRMEGPNTFAEKDMHPQDTFFKIPKYPCMRIPKPSRGDKDLFTREVAECLDKYPKGVPMPDWVKLEFEPLGEEVENQEEEDLTKEGAVTSRRAHLASLGGAPKSSLRKRMIRKGEEPERHFQKAKELVHPVDRESLVDPNLQRVLRRNAALSNQEVKKERVQAAAWVFQEAQRLFDANRKSIRKAKGCVQKVLRRKSHTVHLELLRRLASLANHPDKDYIDYILEGGKLVGEMPKSNLWKPLKKETAEKNKISVEELFRRYPEIAERLKAREGPTKEADALWEATLKDLKSQWAEGPFYSREEVQNYLGEEVFFDAPRFDVTVPRPMFVENGDGSRELIMMMKTRAIDDERSNMVNDASLVREAMVCTSPDEIAAHIRLAEELWPGQKLGGGAVDQKSAYRTIPVRESDLRYCVTSVWCPEKQKQCWIVLLGHAF